MASAKSAAKIRFDSCALRGGINGACSGHLHVERQSEKERVRELRGVPEGGGSHGGSVRMGEGQREIERERTEKWRRYSTDEVESPPRGREGKVKRRETKRGQEGARERERRTTVVTVVLSLLLRLRRLGGVVKPGYRARLVREE